MPSLPGTWRIRVTKYSAKLNETCVDFIGLFLQSDMKSSASCRVSAHLSILKKGGGRVERKLNSNLFNQDSSTHGFPRFLSWPKLTNTGAGLIDNDHITFEVQMKKVGNLAMQDPNNQPSKKLKLSDQSPLSDPSGTSTSLKPQPQKLRYFYTAFYGS